MSTSPDCEQCGKGMRERRYRHTGHVFAWRCDSCGHDVPAIGEERRKAHKMGKEIKTWPR